MDAMAATEIIKEAKEHLAEYIEMNPTYGMNYVVGYLAQKLVYQMELTEYYKRVADARLSAK